jgi:radical SAM superfamily enzyme YgiQ (UPF0313 family)
MTLNNFRNIYGLFEERAKKTPDRIAVISGKQKLTCNRGATFLELIEAADLLAKHLKTGGAAEGDIVGVVVDRSIETVIRILGILRAGAAYLPIAPGTPRAGIVSILEDWQASILLAETGVIERHSFRVPVYVTAPRPQITDFNGMPIPDRSLVDYEKYDKYIGQALVKHGISLQGTRGCPYHCAYCHKIWPKKYVVRSAENIFAELQLYYNMGVRRFAFIDDIFNLDIANSTRFFQLIIENGLDIQLFFPNGLRGDILTEEYIDLMVRAGTVLIPFALETASPRLQKLIGKNLKLDKFRRNIEYVSEKYPHVILDLFTMHGFPTETEEEAMMTLNFIKSLKWCHFVYVFVVKIFPNTDLAKLAIDHGVSPEAISRSDKLALHELPDTLPFDKGFTLKYQAAFFNEYFLSKERLLYVLPHQMRILSEGDIVQKYNSYLPVDIKEFSALLRFLGIDRDELKVNRCLPEESVCVPHLNEKIRKHFPMKKGPGTALKIMLLDLAQAFSGEAHQLNDLVEPPIGLMYILTYLNEQFGSEINGRIAKSRIDFDSYDQLKELLDEFEPEVIGIRSLNFYKDFFHTTAAKIRQWGIDVPVIAGGPYATSSYESILQDRNIDLVVLGEGEITFSELIGKVLENGGRLPGEKELQEIEGIAFAGGKENSQKVFFDVTRNLNEFIERILKKIIETPGVDLSEIKMFSEDEEREITEFGYSNDGENYDFE